MRSLLFITFAFQLFFACQTSQKILKAEKTLNSSNLIEDSVSRILKNGDFAENQNAITIQVSYYESPLLPYQKTINNSILSFIQNFGDAANSKQSILDSNSISQVLIDFENSYLKDLEESDVDMLYGLDVNIDVNTEFENLDLLSKQYYVYTGGAHPNSGLYYDVIEHQSARKILLSDLTSDTVAFNKIALKSFYEAAELEEGADLNGEGFWFKDGVFSCNNNFTFEGDKILFLFNQYEIASYAQGQFYIEIPIEEVEHLLAVKIKRRT